MKALDQLEPLRRRWRKLYLRARLDIWFPQLPLALAQGVAGALALLPAVRKYLFEYFHLQLNGLFDALHPLSAQVPELILRGVPTAITGGLQIFIALGLLLGYGLSWLGGHYRFIHLDASVYSIDYLPFAPRVVDALIVGAVSLGVSLVATIYPSGSAAKVLPAEALRYE